jgi:hypothetical protein
MSKTESPKFTVSVKAATKHRLEKLAKIAGRSSSFLAAEARTLGPAAREHHRAASSSPVAVPVAIELHSATNASRTTTILVTSWPPAATLSLVCFKNSLV